MNRLEQRFSPLKSDRLPPELDSVCEQVVKKKLDYPDFLENALAAEWAACNRKGIESWMKHACFPWLKMIEQFAFESQPSIDRQWVRNLAKLTFGERAENVVLLGPPCLGKTHFAVALRVKAVVAGHRVMDRTLQQLVYPPAAGLR